MVRGTGFVTRDRIKDALDALDAHYEAFDRAKRFSDPVKHPVPCDTRAWSQILVSLLTDILGRGREKGSDLEDGSDVKAANVWSAIDTPRFNGAIPAGRKSKKSMRAPDVTALDATPHIFFVLWDYMGAEQFPRCRVWCVRPKEDRVFRDVCAKWYKQRDQGLIKSDNFQLQPPRNTDDNVVWNKCGNLDLPLLLSAVRVKGCFEVVKDDPSVLTTGACKLAL